LFKITLVDKLFYVDHVSENSNFQDSFHGDCIAMKSFQVVEQCEDGLRSILCRLSVSGLSEVGMMMMMQPHTAFIAKSMLCAVQWI
jgi:hypothetical protein